MSKEIRNSILTDLYIHHVDSELPQPVWRKYGDFIERGPVALISGPCGHGHGSFERLLWDVEYALEQFLWRIETERGVNVGGYRWEGFPPTDAAWEGFLRDFFWLLREYDGSTDWLGAAKLYSWRFQELVWDANHPLTAEDLPDPQEVYNEVVARRQALGW